jgi:hypothetical protein
MGKVNRSSVKWTFPFILIYRFLIIFSRYNYLQLIKLYNYRMGLIPLLSLFFRGLRQTSTVTYHHWCIVYLARFFFVLQIVRYYPFHFHSYEQPLRDTLALCWENKVGNHFWLYIWKLIANVTKLQLFFCFCLYVHVSYSGDEEKDWKHQMSYSGEEKRNENNKCAFCDREKIKSHLFFEWVVY